MADIKREFLVAAAKARLAETDDDTWTVKAVTNNEVVLHKGDAEWCPVDVRLQASTVEKLDDEWWGACDDSNTEYRVRFE